MVSLCDSLWRKVGECLCEHLSPSLCIVQVDNAFRVVDMGLGVRVPLAQLSNSTLYAALTTVLDGASYRVAGARLSKIEKATGGYKEGADWVE